MIGKVKQKALTVLGLIVGMGITYGRVDMEYIKWARGEFQMPSILRQVDSQDLLWPYLQGDDEFLRMAAVRRLAQIEGPRAASQLCQIALKEQPPRGFDYVPLAKLEVVRSLDRMEGPDPEQALIDLMMDYWAKRADIRSDRVFAVFDVYPVVSMLLDALDKRSGSNAVLRLIGDMALSPDVARNDLLPAWLRQRIWEVYLRGQMIRSGTVVKEDQLERLLEELNTVERRWPFEYLSLDHIKALGVRALIKRYDAEALSSVARRLEQAIASKSYDLDKDPKGRYKEITGNLALIRAILRDRASRPQVPRN